MFGRCNNTWFVSWYVLFFLYVNTKRYMEIYFTFLIEINKIENLTFLPEKNADTNVEVKLSTNGIKHYIYKWVFSREAKLVDQVHAEILLLFNRKKQIFNCFFLYLSTVLEACTSRYISFSFPVVLQAFNGLNYIYYLVDIMFL